MAMAKITDQIKRLERASTGEEVRSALLDSLNRLNIYHSQYFETEYEPKDPHAYDEQVPN